MKNTFTDLLIRKRTLFTRNQLTALIMRMSQVYLLIMVSAMITMAAPKGNGQSIETTVVNLEIVNKPLKQALKEIEKQTPFLFMWDGATEKSFPRVSLPKGRYSVREALDQLLLGTETEFKQNENHIIILHSEESDIGSYESDNRTSQHRTQTPALITGIVKDASTQEPLAGVNIIVKGTTRGTTTDVEGKYKIEANESEVLVFSYIGFKTLETHLDGRTTLDILMEMDLSSLKEVEVNAGYWSVKDREQTGNISKVSASEIQKQPVSNPLGALEGRMPGVYINQITGLPGGNFSVQIRGQNSLRSDGNDPLYLIDGIPYVSKTLSTGPGAQVLYTGTNPLSAINPSDIESIEVLKDADATAIYGSRGANGVVLITTKKGKPENSKINVNVYQGAGKVARRMELLNTREYLQMRNEAVKNDGLTLQPDWAIYYPDLMRWDSTRNTDWQKELIGGTAYTTNVQTSLSGGNANTQFLVSAGFYKEGTVFPGNFSYKKASGHFNLNHSSLNKKFTFTMSLNYIADINNLPKTDITSQAISLAPNAPSLYDEEGNLNWEDNTWANPIAYYLKPSYRSNTDNLVANTVISYSILPGLNVKSNFGYTSTLFKELSTTPKSSYYPDYFAYFTPYSSFGDTGLKTWIIEPQLNYQNTIGDGTLNVMIGSSFQESVQESKNLTATGFASDALLENIKAASTISIGSFNHTQYRYNAIFGRLNYDLKGKYIINLTGRRDGSSRFGPGKRFANFGAVGAAWIFSNEKFVSSQFGLLSFGKLRCSYGLTGSDQISDYGYLDSYRSTVYPHEGIGGLVPTRLANPNYSWEANRKFEAALEFGLLQDRIFGSASWYRNRSSNQLVGYPLPVVTGFSDIQFNLPATVENTGWEFELSTANLNTASFAWKTDVNFSIPRNKLLEYPSIETSPYNFAYKVGEPLSIRRSLHLLGVDTETGVYRFEDVDQNGKETEFPGDYKALKSLSRNFFGGVLNTFNYKGFQLDVFVQFVKQTGLNYLSNGFSIPGSFSNQPIEVLNRWRQPGDNTNIQKFTLGSGTPAGQSYSSVRSSDYSISDASFIRLKNVSLSWQFPQALSRKMKFQRSRLYVQGQNLATLTNYKGMDPENQNAPLLPPLRMLTAGLEFTF